MGKLCCGLLCVEMLFLLVITLAAVPVASDWRGCIAELERMFLTPNKDAYKWTEEATEACGYSTIRLEGHPTASPASEQNVTDSGVPQDLAWLEGRTITFMGDSTSHYLYIFTVNVLSVLEAQLVYRRVTEVETERSRRIELRPGGGRILNDEGTEVVIGDRRLGRPRPSVRVRFYKMLHASLGSLAIQKMLNAHPEDPAGTGIVIMSLGNWDMNWKMNPKTKIPLLGGPKHHWPTAQAYWTKYVDKVFDTLAAELPLQPPSRRPLVIFRELYMLNCSSYRFTNKNRLYRQCAPLLAPIVIPYYRRGLARLSWSIDVPVIPAFLRDRSVVCQMYDGIHLDKQCRYFELQVALNVARMMLAMPLPEQGVPALDGQPLPASAPFCESAEKYNQWWSEFVRAHTSLRATAVSEGTTPSSSDINEPTTAAQASVAPATEPDTTEGSAAPDVDEAELQVTDAPDAAAQGSVAQTLENPQPAPDEPTTPEERVLLVEVLGEPDAAEGPTVVRRKLRGNTSWTAFAMNVLLVAGIFVLVLMLSVRYVM